MEHRLMNGAPPPPAPERVEVRPAEALAIGYDIIKTANFEEALPIFQAVCEAEPHNSEAAGAVGACLTELGRHEEALPWFDRAMVNVRAQMIALTCNRGKALGELGRTDEALSLYNNIVRNDPGNPLGYYNRGLMLMQKGNYRGAILDFNEALARGPDEPKALFGRGFANLVRGNYEDGFRDYEYRLKDQINEPLVELWDGSQSLQGKSILVHGEQGHGDDIMFMRYVPMMVAQGARVYLVLHPGVRPLFEGMPGTVMLSEDHASWPVTHYWVRMMSLARCFRTKVDTVPPPPPLMLEPRDDIKRAGWLRVGLVWSGSPNSRYDAHRSIPLACLAPLFDLKGVQFFSLQLGVRGRDLDALERAPLVDLTGDIKNFRDTANIISQLDAVVSVDTSVAHLAGTVGVPTYLMLTAFRTYWLWIQDRASSPWYPSIKVFRQPSDGDWVPVVAAVRQALARAVKAAA